MDEIIGLLFLIVPVVFSLIGKKLEKAGKDEAPDVLPEPHVQEVRPEEAPRSIRKPLKPYKPHRTAGEAPETPRRKDPIDPKKLVIYSEIMKPKFKE